jgi:uncharacterized membrane protein YbaN (DUF454 family)
VRLRLTLPSRSQLATVARYGAAGGAYVAIGLGFVDFMLSVFVAMAYLLVAAWLLPTALRRFR